MADQIDSLAELITIRPIIVIAEPIADEWKVSSRVLTKDQRVDHQLGHGWAFCR